MTQTTAVARQRASFILDGEAAPGKVLELLAQLTPYVEKMATRREWTAMSIIEAAQLAVGRWMAALENAATSPDDQQAQAVNFANEMKLAVHSHLVHLGQRMPRTVRGDDEATNVLRALALITAATRFAPTEYVPNGTGTESGAAALHRISQAEADSRQRREVALSRRAARLAETAASVAVDTAGVEGSK